MVVGFAGFPGTCHRDPQGTLSFRKNSGLPAMSLTPAWFTGPETTASPPGHNFHRYC